MKNVLTVLFVLFISITAFSQTLTENPSGYDSTVYSAVETKPEFEGGIQQFYKFIGANYKVPNVKGLKGKIYMQFVVEKDGSLADIKIIRDLGHGTGEEAVRVLSLCPKWTPGKQKGIPVRVLYSLPISIDSKK